MRMTNRHGFASFAGAPQRQFELFADRGYFGEVVQERDVAEGGAHSKVLRRIVSHGSGGGGAGTGKEGTVAQHLHKTVPQTTACQPLPSLQSVGPAVVRK